MFCKIIRTIPAFGVLLVVSSITSCSSMPRVRVTFGSFANAKEDRGNTPPPISPVAEPAPVAPATATAAPSSLPEAPASDIPVPAPSAAVTPSTPAPVVADPFIDFDLRQKLAAGHTLKLDVYTGQRSPKRLFEGEVVIDDAGNADFSKHGAVKLGGLTADQAVRAITSMFQSQGADRILSIHLKSIENLPVITVSGAVKKAGIIRWFDTATPASILPYAGNRSGSGEAVYISREGTRVFHPNVAAASASGTLQPGDIVTFTSDL